MVALLLDAITVQYGDDVVVDGLTLRVEQGESVALLGPSGSGKTSVLRAVAGLEFPSSGDVLFDGQRVNEVPPAQRNLAMVFQENALFPKMTVEKNVGFPLRVRQVPAREIASRVEAETRATGISGLLRRHPRQLSAGQQQLVQLARAMVRRPALMLVDEPFARLDHLGSGRLRAELRLVQSGYGVTALYATHDYSDAMALADRVALIDAGRIRQVGAPEQIYARPTDTFVATFVGNPPMDLLGSELAPGGVSVGGMFLPVPRPLPRRVLVGVRPEDWKVGERGLETRVERIFSVGPDSFAVVDTPAGQVTLRSRADSFDPGPKRIHPKRFHVFDHGRGVALYHSGS